MNKADFDSRLRRVQRRTFLAESGVGLGSLALAMLMGRDSPAGESRTDNATRPGAGAAYRGLPELPNLAPRVKRVIFLCMAGGPSHLETFDYKPELARLDGQPMPESFTKGQPIAQLQGQELRAQGPLTRFHQYGAGGQWISDFLPWHQKIADDICIVRSMVTEQINHDPAHTFMNTGTAISGRPSMGAWINYGLGAETDDLPGFVVLTSIGGRKSDQPIASRQWAAGFLPSRFQGVEFSSSGDPVQYVGRPPGVPAALERATVETIQHLDRRRNRDLASADLEGRIAAYETAFRMQTSVPELMDMSDESAAVMDMYGAKPGDGSFGANCLLARRLAERGVRFIHLYHRGWDHHGNLVRDMQSACDHTDRGCYALITDLKQRGMLDETLVIWGGEFGRTPMNEKRGGSKFLGRDHHPHCFSIWMAGGGIKPGVTLGATDELGYFVAEDKVHVHDLQATILHLLGLDHKRLTFKFQGRDFRLTDVAGNVVQKLLA